MRLTVLLATPVAALALVAAGCGGGDDEAAETSSTVEWADGFCGAISSWTDALEEVGQRFTDLSSVNQESLEGAAGDARTATDDLVDELRGLGTPDTESGEEAKRAVDDLASELEDAMDEIDETVEGISGVTGLPSAITSLSATLASMSQALSTAVSSLRGGAVMDELESAFRESPACDELTESSS